ncbi:glycoside hydrolase superfamily [Tricharina praecox]|uniref:glycoside hydrolase superfamily n=1 Tax=Tricharina praecox TaxID=43433 RepID=UPI0022207E46|nr:glycoside hydrolase superfamily [Tricharina praecox]KAI5849897.1 glycoside hydrolase superfamily [Tricharina praecox]
MRFITLLSGILGAFAATAIAADAEAWKTRSIYFVLTDRFAKTSSDTSACTSLGSYCGGTWAGMEARLDYIKGLGFDAIWITPVVENTSNGYHGYWAKNLYNVNTNYGSANDLKSLVQAAHNKGMYIMVDVVANHMGIGAYSDFTPFNSEDYFHSYCVISDYNNQENVEDCRITSDLPDIKTEDTSIRSTLNSWVKDLVSTYSFDGLRIDTVKHVEKDFWPGFVSASGVFSMGEVYNGDPAYVGPYQDYVTSLVNFPMYYSIQAAYASKGSLQELVTQHDKVSSNFDRPELLGTFLDNHDVVRFLNVNSDWTALKNALAYTLLARGIPILYGGTEQGYTGGSDPANREDLWRSGYSTTGDLYGWIKKAMAAKTAAGGLGANDHSHLYTTSTAYAFSRAGGKLVVLTTNGGSGTSGTHCFNTNVASGTVFTSALGTATYTAGSNGNICVTVSNGQPEILLS